MDTSNNPSTTAPSTPDDQWSSEASTTSTSPSETGWTPSQYTTADDVRVSTVEPEVTTEDVISQKEDPVLDPPSVRVVMTAKVNITAAKPVQPVREHKSPSLDVPQNHPPIVSPSKIVRNRLEKEVLEDPWKRKEIVKVKKEAQPKSQEPTTTVSTSGEVEENRNGTTVSKTDEKGTTDEGMETEEASLEQTSQSTDVDLARSSTVELQSSATSQFPDSVESAVFHTPLPIPQALVHPAPRRTQSPGNSNLAPPYSVSDSDTPSSPLTSSPITSSTSPTSPTTSPILSTHSLPPSSPSPIPTPHSPPPSSPSPPPSSSSPTSTPHSPPPSSPPSSSSPTSTSHSPPPSSPSPPPSSPSATSTSHSPPPSSPSPPPSSPSATSTLHSPPPSPLPVSSTNSSTTTHPAPSTPTTKPTKTSTITSSPSSSTLTPTSSTLNPVFTHSTPTTYRTLQSSVRPSRASTNIESILNVNLMPGSSKNTTQLSVATTSTTVGYVQILPQVSSQSPVLAIALPSVFGIMLLSILATVLFVVYRRHKHPRENEKCLDAENTRFVPQTTISDMYFLPADNISVNSLYSKVADSRDSQFDDGATELLLDNASNIYDQIQHSPPIYQNTTLPLRSNSVSGYSTTMVDNSMYEGSSETAHPHLHPHPHPRPPNVYQRLASASTSTPRQPPQPPLLVRRPSNRTRTTPDYDSVYVPHSDAYAMARRLDRSGYVQTSRLSPGYGRTYEDLPIHIIHGCSSYPPASCHVPILTLPPCSPRCTAVAFPTPDASRVSLEFDVPVLSAEEMLEDDEHNDVHLSHVYSSVVLEMGQPDSDVISDDTRSSDEDSDSSFEALYHDINDDIRDQIYEAVNF